MLIVKYHVFLFSLILLTSCGQKVPIGSDDKVLSTLEDLYRRENYFKLKDYTEAHIQKLSDKDQYYYSAIISSAFCDYAASNQFIDNLISGPAYSLNDTELMNLHNTKFMNFYNQYDYKNAYSECNVLLENYEAVMDSIKYVQLHNYNKILEALKDSPAQIIIKEDNSDILMQRDNMGLLNLKIMVEEDSLNFLFDTGSSFSFIRRSLAEQLHLKIFDIDIEVEGATGKPVICDLAMIPEFNLANIIVKNTVFWVFDDADLTIPEYNYKVNGAIGFPIIKSLDEIHIINKYELFIPEYPAKYSVNNLAIDDQDPVIAIIQKGDTLPYYFDTGAAFSSLYKPFYTSNSGFVDSSLEQHTYTIGSLGGTKEFTSYVLDSIQLTVAGKSAWIYDVEIFTDNIYKDAEKVYGNLGQDFIYQFNKMIISTKYSTVLFD